MPYKIVKREKRWCVVRERDGGRPQRTLHCYPENQRSAAEAYLRALHAHEPRGT